MGYYMDMTDCKFKVKAENSDKAARLLNEFDFEPETDADGNIVNLDFVGEKLRDHEKMCRQIASCVENDSYIEMRGEDGAMWRWVFRNGECHEIEAVIRWPDMP
jgi:hypothetical protein